MNIMMVQIYDDYPNDDADLANGDYDGALIDSPMDNANLIDVP